MLAIVAPGQGAQKPGMLVPWLEVTGLSALAESFAAAGGIDLIRLGTTADADEIKDTAVTQPLVVASALLAATTLTIPADAASAGHSVGELAAAAVAGVIDAETAVRAAGIRGAAMARACALTPTSMSAVLGGDTDAVLDALNALELVGANVNGGGQIVAAGATDALAALAAHPPAGARVIPLPVAGAFHTAYMSPAQNAVAEYLTGVEATDPSRPLLTNSDGHVVTSGRAYLDLLTAQVTRPVRWDSCMATLAALGVTGVLELPPAGTLIGLIKRDLKGVATLALKTPDDLDKAAAFIDEHSEV
ncbi:[acyl-carrier-protein] S-malonyltransferase [Nakamurella panacisegetis]|uniref:[acyl-carrier-protein] S-malonyltransferase n=1 Tax=Nakamurella panacisegetis TaxID=1090615 RepID=A0A1H0SR40_9ACTN|nr:ACP S-malonyltransferase [Nakamurella panacisegetis]SDP44211.1 [acyl-carrier-protein] S-malonyltransferase [Nakamurella panacisegetis]